MSDLVGRRPDTSNGQDMISRNAALEVQVRDIQGRIAKIDFERRARARNGEEMLTQIKLLGKLVAEQNEMLKISLGVGSQLRQGQQSPDHVQPMALAHDGLEQFSDKASEIKHPLNMPTRSIILKLKIKEEVHRVQLPGTCVNDLGLRHVSETIEKILPDLGSMYIPKYSDNDGDLCTLTSTSFNDFLTFATENAGDKVLTVHICDEKAGPVPKRRDSPQHKPSLFRSLYDLLTMGFAVDRIKILHVQGPESPAEKLRSENGDLSVVNTLLFGMVFEMWLMFLGGDLDHIIVYGENQEIDWHYYVYLALLVGSTACLACSVFCSILLSVMLRNILDENVAQFLQDAGLFLRIPYLGCVHGTQVFLASVCFLCFFRVDPMITGIAITGVSACSVFLVFTSGAKYVQAAYTADFYRSDSK